MTIRAKMFWVALVAVALVCAMSTLLYSRAYQSQRLRQQLMSNQDEVDGFERLHALSWPYVNRLAQARQTGASTGQVLETMKVEVEQEMERLARAQAEELQRSEESGLQAVEGPALRQQYEIRDDLIRWAALAEQRMRALPANVSVAPSVEWLLYVEFEQSVGARIKRAQAEERTEVKRIEDFLNRGVRRSKWVAILAPLLVLLTTALFSAAMLVPLRRSLLTIASAARRIGRGDFDVQTALSSPDELGLLSRAIDRMARELRESLEEKERLSRAEAEASEREARRYHALLEETVRARTQELAEANTRLRDSLRELQATQEQLLSADRLASVGRLAAGVGHEINNPLAFILSNLRYVHQELTDFSGALAEQEREEMLTALAEASEGAERVRLIVQDLKTLARPDEVALGPVDVAAVVRTSGKMARHETRDRARLVEECDGVPPVHANAARLGQVFLNLIINAAHAISPGRVEHNEIRVSARVSAPRQVTVEVRDTGAGIPPEHLRRIFDPFFTTKPVGVGTGLGLSVSYRIINALGGAIHVESEPGRGTSFFITLPVAEAPPEGSPPSA